MTPVVDAMFDRMKSTGGGTSAVATSHRISVKGQMHEVPAWRIDDAVVITRGRFVRTAEIFDTFWLEADKLPDPVSVARKLREVNGRPDLFRFTQRAPDTTPRYNVHLEWDNVAAIPVSTHEQWLHKQISAASRRNIRTSEKKGIVVRSSPFDEAFIRGIIEISNESPIRAGRRYWHYGKSFAAVEEEQGTYRERSTYLAAYLNGEQVGYLKMVWDARTAAIMQIVSKLKHRDKRTNNALLSEAVRLCADRGVGHLLYERYVYGNKENSSLTRFKRENGFVRIDVPTYYIPLTGRGRLALMCGIHRRISDRLPEWLTARLIAHREKWYARRVGTN
jgi:hypothetical protein